ncbi:MAG: glutathione-disulfide reductase [Myxococcota bacterium]
MQSFDFDLITLGAGSGGVAGSRRAAALGARVAICEQERVGGTCVLRGCVPKKLLIYGAHFSEELEDARGYGWSIQDASLDWSALIDAKNRELDRLNGIYLKLLENSGVTLLKGAARLLDAHTVVVGEQKFTAQHIMIATGGVPFRPPIPGVELALTSNEALELKTLPRHIVIIGGGYIGVEFAGIFHAAGAKVTLLVRDDNVLVGFDHELRQHLAAMLRHKGIELHVNARVSAIHKQGEGVKVELQSGASFDADQVMLAVGRRPMTQGLGLEKLGIQLNPRGAIKVDARLRTHQPHIYAVGDVTDKHNLTPVAIAEGRAVAESLFGKNSTQVNLEHMPTAVFSQPPLASVGMTEERARKLFSPPEVYHAHFKPMKNTLAGRDERTFMKLVVDKKTQQVLGAHMLGPDAPEIIQALAVALQCGATKAQFDATLAIHPTAAEEFVLMRTPRA